MSEPAIEEVGRPPGPPAGGGDEPLQRFAVEGWRGEVVTVRRPPDLAGEVRRIVDPASAVETLHWGRNYLYRAELVTAGGRLPVVVKQFRGGGVRERWRRRARGTKAARSLQVAHAMERAGLPTPEPVMAVEAERPGGPSCYVCRYLPGVVEARHLLRAARQGRAAEAFPGIDLDGFLAALGRLVRRFHDAGFQHRDLSVGNVLVRPSAGPPEIWLVDLNRARLGSPPGLLRRSRELSRLALVRRRHRERLLEAYWGGPPGRLRGGLMRFFQAAFEAKQRLKKPLGRLRRSARRLAPRRPHAHIPEAPPGAPIRERAVWDPLSDQPHQHAGRAEKLLVRLADLPAHLEETAALAAAAPGIWRRYRALRRQLYAAPVELGGMGVCLRPWPEDPEGLLAAVEELGARRLLLRLHPWQEDHTAEEDLARELAGRGCELAFALPQTRELVNDPGRWRAAVAELGARFRPYGRCFQVGQAVNRSKWGVWRLEEYVRLAVAAAGELRRLGAVEILGPSVIDFEHHVTAVLLNLDRRGLRFDAVSSLLYVDRRGAPENPQLGFDTVGKITLLRAIAETSRNSSERCWITEVNWPLWEGPHSPAGRKVAVGEQQQADYLVRYYLLALTTGFVERVYWWQLIARGYGLIRPGEGGTLVRRPAFRALATLLRQLAGASSLGPLPCPPGGWLLGFRRSVDAGGPEMVVGWSAAPRPLSARLPRPAAAVVGRDGEELPPPDGEEVELLPSPRYFVLDG